MGQPLSEPRESSVVFNVLRRGQFAFGEGFYAGEGLVGGLPRWTNGDGAIDLYPPPGRLTIHMLVRKPNFGIFHFVPDLKLLWDGSAALPGGLSSSPLPNDQYQLTINLAVPEPGSQHRLEIVSDTFGGDVQRQN